MQLRRLQGVSNSRLSRKAKKMTGSTSIQTGYKILNEVKSAGRHETSASQAFSLKSSKFATDQGDFNASSDAYDNIAICESDYDLDDKAQIFSQYVSQGKPSRNRSDSFPRPNLEPHWKEVQSSSRPSSSASVRHYISFTVPSELGLGTEHRGNIKRLLEAKSYCENEFFPAPRVDYKFDKYNSKRPSSSASSRASSRPSSSIASNAMTSTPFLLSKDLSEQSTRSRNIVARPVWLNMIVITGAAALQSKIESPFQAAAFENAVKKNNPQLAIQIAESNLTTARTSQSQDQYDAYILAIISFSIIEAMKIVLDKSDSSCLILLQVAEENIR
jgi:hypothetical protein